METNSISASVHGSPNLQIPPQADVRKWKSRLIYSATHYEGSVDWNPMEEYLCTQAAVIQLNAFPLRRFKSGLSSCVCSLFTRHPLNFPRDQLMNFPNLQMVGNGHSSYFVQRGCFTVSEV